MLDWGHRYILVRRSSLCLKKPIGSVRSSDVKPAAPACWTCRESGRFPNFSPPPVPSTVSPGEQEGRFDVILDFIHNR